MHYMNTIANTLSKYRSKYLNDCFQVLRSELENFEDLFTSISWTYTGISTDWTEVVCVDLEGNKAVYMPYLDYSDKPSYIQDLMELIYLVESIFKKYSFEFHNKELTMTYIGRNYN